MAHKRAMEYYQSETQKTEIICGNTKPCMKTIFSAVGCVRI